MRKSPVLDDLKSVSAMDPIVFTGQKGNINSVAFSPNGKSLATASADSTIWLWPTLETIAELACQKVRRNLTRDEWQRYFGNEPYRQTCPNLPPDSSIPK